ncbi:MAG: response regulator [Planctomycetota bacterium]|jgi:CheY-like chemotaxis protein
MENAKILIVDDDPDFVVVMKTVLEGEKYTVDTAPGKTEALEKLRAGKPDLLILDVMMNTWSDGFEMARDLRKNPDYKDIPIIMLTGVEQRTGIEFKSAAGDSEWLPVDAFLDKPVESKVLLAEVEKLLSNRG